MLHNVGVLVLGIGSGTTQLQSYLEGDKRYVAVCELGYETTTLDAEGDIVKEMAWDHVQSVFNQEESTATSSVQSVLPKFRGKISQVPPLYSAIRVDGKRLYEIARKNDGSSEENKQDVEIPTRQVEIYELDVSTSLEEAVLRSGVVNGRKYRELAEEMTKQQKKDADDAKVADDAESGTEKDEESKSKSKNKKGKRNNKAKDNKKNNLFTDETIPTISFAENNFDLPQFALQISCGGGTYIRSLVRDIGYECGSVATMTGLVRTKQGPFLLGDALRREDWNADKIYEAIEKNNKDASVQ
eukprot:CCRYP_000707-RA/>CCRYP_000707-RA protein AED:0.33 eAED:0.33 QI:95/-1/1/1/-1/1/1/232/299